MERGRAIRWAAAAGGLLLASAAGAEDSRPLFDALLARVHRGGPNHLHSRRLFHYAPAFAAPAGANLDAVRAAALLHDSTKEDGAGEPKERFCTHGEQGAAYARAVLRRLGKPDDFAQSVAEAIRQHMGPCGRDEKTGSVRFMSRFCAGHLFPAPKSPEAKVLYDLDMLDLMTVNGVAKVVELRQKGPEFGKETVRESALAGPDSAWKSVNDARQTLLTPAAIACGDALAAHTRAFLDVVDWERVKDVPAFQAAVQRYLAEKPLPACLPPVPACGAPGTVAEC